jgi:hypothetical protein
LAYIMTCNGLTGAQRIKTALERACISAFLTRPPQEIAEEGCGYAVEVKDSQLVRAVRTIRDCRLSFRKVYRKDGTAYTEVPV